MGFLGDALSRDIFTGLTPEEAAEAERLREQEIANRPVALVPCKACGKQISAEADACIHCGQPMNTAIKCPNCRSPKRGRRALTHRFVLTRQRAEPHALRASGWRKRHLAAQRDSPS